MACILLDNKTIEQNEIIDNEIISLYDFETNGNPFDNLIDRSETSSPFDFNSGETNIIGEYQWNESDIEFDLNESNEDGVNIMEDTPVDDTPVENTPVENTPVDDTPVENTPVENTPVENTPVDNTPVEDTPVEDTPAEDTPAEDTPVEDTSVEEDSGDETESDEGREYNFPERETLEEKAQKIMLTDVNVFNNALDIFEDDNESESTESAQDQVDLIRQAMDKRMKEKDMEIERLKRSLNKRKRNETISRSVRRKSCELRFDEYGEEQTLGNYIIDENDRLQWSPPFGNSYDGLFYCHDPECRRRFTSARSLKIHIFCVGNKYRNGNPRYNNGRAGHNAECDDSESYLMMRCGREFIPENWNPYSECTLCNHREINRKNLLRHIRREHITIPAQLPDSLVEDYVSERLLEILPKKRKGTALTRGVSKVYGNDVRV